jgi:lipopolysaccharide assembly protein A
VAKIVGFLFLLLIVLLGLSFALLNAQPAVIDYYFGAATLPLSLILVLALILGALLGVMASLGVILRQRRELVRLRRNAGHVRKELNELRKLPMKDAVG